MTVTGSRRVRVETLHRGFGFSEGPVVLSDGAVAFCDGTHGVILCTRGGAVTEVANVGGSPNGLALGSDGTLYVTRMAPWHPAQLDMPPALLRIDEKSNVQTLTTGTLDRSFVAPNDLAFGPDGRLVLTDSGDDDHVHPAGPSRIFAFDGKETECLHELKPCFANGIAFDAAGALLWTETTTRRLRRLTDGTAQTIATLPPGHLPDGFAVARDGRVYVATFSSGGISVVSPEGALLEHLDVGAEPTNCAFLGSTLVVTASTDSSGDPGTGLLLAIETDAEPLELRQGQV